MDVSFDNQKRAERNPAPVTRIYAPSRNKSQVRVVEEVADLPVYPQPRERDLEKREAPVQKVPIYSRVLLLVSIFLIAGTAIFAISGSARVAQIYTQIYTLENEIEDYNEKISLLKKQQSTMTDYSTIDQANRDAGRVMTWNED